MLSYTRLDNGYTFSLKQLSVTYDSRQIGELIPKLRSSDFIISHLKQNAPPDPFDIFDDHRCSSITTHNPLFNPGTLNNN
jgi:hypothetical protein